MNEVVQGVEVAREGTRCADEEQALFAVTGANNDVTDMATDMANNDVTDMTTNRLTATRLMTGLALGFAGTSLTGTSFAGTSSARTSFTGTSLEVTHG
jgi:hypothetical protein